MNGAHQAVKTAIYHRTPLSTRAYSANVSFASVFEPLAN